MGIRHGIATGRAERDVTADLRGALPSPAKGHYPAITEPKPLAQLLRDIDAYGGNFVVRTALQLQPLIFARPANLAHAERNRVKAAYNRAQHLPERRKMMQAWADYLDKLKQGADIIPLHKTAS